MRSKFGRWGYKEAIKMDTDLIKSIITLIIALIPLIILITTYFLNRTERTNQPLDSSSLKVFNIVRYPIDAKQWEILANRNRISKFKIITLGLMVYVSLIAVAFFFGIETVNLVMEITVLVIATLFIGLLPIVLDRTYVSRFKTADNANYFVFKDTLILIESNYHYLFNKCHETLRSMNLKIVKVDESAGTLEALQGRRLIRDFAKLRVQINKVEGSESVYVIGLNVDITKGKSMMIYFIALLLINFYR